MLYITGGGIGHREFLRLAAVLLPDFMQHRARPANHDTPDKHSMLNILLLLRTDIHDQLTFWGSDAMAQRDRDGRSHFERIVERIVERMGINVYSSSHIGMLGMAWRLKVYL